MKKQTWITLLALIAVCLLGPSVAQAQTATTLTTLSAAVTSATQSTISITSNTGVSASTSTAEQDFFVDGELMKVLSQIGTTTTWNVARGQNRTRSTVHPNGSYVYFGPAGRAPFVGQAPNPGTNCTASQFQFLPLINIATGQLHTCTGGVWLTLNATGQQSDVHSRTAIANVAYQALITDEIIGYTSIQAQRIVTLPSPSGFPGKTIIVKDESGSAGTFTIAINPPSGVKLDGSTGVANGVNSVRTNFGVLRLYTDGTNWFTF